MPFPYIPDASWIGIERIGNLQCNHFIHKDGDAVVHVFMDAASNAPVRLIQESIEKGISTPMLTYDYSEVVLGQPDGALFELPSPYTHFECERFIGGFPYLHVFHYFVRF